MNSITITATDDTIEIMAEAAYLNAASGHDGEKIHVTPWTEASPRFRVTFRRQARASLAALARHQEATTPSTHEEAGEL